MSVQIEYCKVILLMYTIIETVLIIKRLILCWTTLTFIWQVTDRQIINIPTSWCVFTHISLHSKQCKYHTCQYIISFIMSCLTLFPDYHYLIHIKVISTLYLPRISVFTARCRWWVRCCSLCVHCEGVDHTVATLITGTSTTVCIRAGPGAVRITITMQPYHLFHTMHLV